MLSQDLQVAWKFLRKRPVFALAVILTLCLGIGVNATVFSLIDKLVLRSLPFPDPASLVVPVTVDLSKRMTRGPVAYADFLQWRRTGLFAGLALVEIGDFDLVSAGEPQKVDGAAVSAEYFPLLRSRPVLGRGLEAGDFGPTAEKVVVLSRGLWQRAFGSRPDVLGKTLRLGDLVYTIVGVFASEDASLLARHQLWIPLDVGFPVSAELMRPDSYRFRAIARLKPGVSIAQAQAQLTTLAARVARDEPQTRANVDIELLPLRQWLIRTQFQLAMLTILAAVFLVLMIVCLNIAGLLLVRAAERQKEIAIRLALGAQRRQLIRQLLAESLALAIPGGIGGVALAAWGIGLVKTVAPARLPLSQLGLNASVLIFAVVLTVLTALAVGLMPALQLSSVPLSDFLRETGSGAGSDRRLRRRQSVLVVAELAVSLVLLTLAGMAIHNIGELLQREGGVQMENRITMEVELPPERYPEKARREAFFQTLLERIGHLPQVRHAAASSSLPLGGGGSRLRASFLPDGQPDPPGGKDFHAYATSVTPEYFRAAGIPLLRGRAFAEQDSSGASRVVIVSKTLADQMFPGQDLIGRRIRETRTPDVYEVVGVVGNVRYQGLGDDWQPMIYLPYRQIEEPPLEKLVIHAAGDPFSLVGSIRNEVWSLDPKLPVSRIRTFEQIAAESITASRYTSWLLGGLSAFALLLAAIGLYGIVSYTVTQRTQEIGVRMALGARRRDVIWGVIRQGLVLCLAGGVIGLLVAPMLGMGLSQVLVVGMSPVTYLAVAALLVLVVVLASLLPAWKASRVAPAEALRYE
jgi:putative ABC transport system permease protein